MTRSKINQILTSKEKNHLVILLILMIVGSFLEVLGVGAIPAFIAVITSPEKIMENRHLSKYFGFISIYDQKNLLIYGSLFLFILFLVKNSLLNILQYISSSFIAKLKHQLETRLFSNYIYAPYAFHLTHNSAKIINNITNEVQIIVNTILIGALKLVMNGAMVIMIILLLLFTDPIITVVVIGLLGGGSLIMLRIIKRRLNKYGHIAQENRARAIKALNEGLGGIKEAKVLNREYSFFDTFRITSQNTTQSNRYYQYISNSTKYSIETIAVLGMLSIIVILSLKGSDTTSIIPIIILFAAAFIRLMPALQQLVNSYTTIKYALPSLTPVAEDITTLRKLQSTSKSISDVSEKLHISQQLSISNVFFSYDEGENVLKGIDINVDSGATIGLVGPSGSGKSTLVNIILGLLSPTKGEVLADGANIHQQLEKWHNSVGYIPQEIYLLDDTIRKNIAFGISTNEIDEGAVERAMQMAQLKELINSLPNGLDTIIGERGTRLSGGQKQRIGIARALYHNPGLIIMDEATSALDNLTEKSIMEAIDKLKGHCTIIMIAHRLSTVKNCDCLYFLKEGKIEASGTFEKLIATNHEFKSAAALLT